MNLTFYGFAYFFTFVIAYAFFYWIGASAKFSFLWNTQQVIKKNLDDLAICVLVGLLLWGRIGYFVPLWWDYFVANWTNLLKIWQWWMAFVGWAIGVGLGLLCFKLLKKISWSDILKILDLIVLVVPLGIFLGRIWNFFNQEIVWISIDRLPLSLQKIFVNLGLVYHYTWWWESLRVNINFLEAIGEGLLLFVLLWYLFKKVYSRRVAPGFLTGVFLLWYGFIRFFLEMWKYYPEGYIGCFSLAQWWMILFVVVGSILTILAWRWKTK